MANHRGAKPCKTKGQYTENSKANVKMSDLTLSGSLSISNAVAATPILFNCSTWSFIMALRARQTTLIMKVVLAFPFITDISCEKSWKITGGKDCKDICHWTYFYAILLFFAKALYLGKTFKVAQNSFQHIPRLRFWFVIITTIYQLMLQSWYQKTAQSLMNTLVLFSWHSRLPWQHHDLLKTPLILALSAHISKTARWNFFLLYNFDKQDETQHVQNSVHGVQSHLKFSKI